MDRAGAAGAGAGAGAVGVSDGCRARNEDGCSGEELWLALRGVVVAAAAGGGELEREAVAVGGCGAVAVGGGAAELRGRVGNKPERGDRF